MQFLATRFSPAKLIAWLMAVSILAGPLAGPARAQMIEDSATVETQEADALNEAQDSSADPDDDNAFLKRGGDNFKSPKAADRYQRRQEALKQKLAGKPSNGKVHEVAKGQYVELGLERNDRVFVILVEYGNGTAQHPTPTAVPAPTPPSAAPGPLHNQIPEPNRALDNNTIWQPNYDRAHFADMYFNRMVNYYQTQSSGRYTINGDVTEWVKVPFNGPRYGANVMGDAGAWTLIADAINIWTKQQLASGKTLAEVTDYLKTFDVWDRYDYNNNGNFDEPDGYIDHFQIVHSGAGEETGGGTLRTDAIWSHRWQAWYNRGGIDGPSYNKDGGVQFGGGWGANPSGTTVSSANASFATATAPTRANVMNAHPVTPTGVWVGDYTIQPENGGLGVFAHEYGHDLGLPDHYDTNSGANSTGFWTIMSSGSYLGDGTTDIGSRPGDFGAWDKLQLGWLNYETVDPAVKSSVRLGPAETNTKQAQAVVVPLAPEKNVFHLYDPTAGKFQYGTKAWWGGKADNLDTNMVRQVTVPAGTSALTMRLQYNIENNWDYAYVSVSTNGGTTWTNLAGTWPGGANGAQIALTTNTNANGQNLGNGITGSTAGAWRLASFNTTPYAGQTVLLRLRYKTDAFTVLNGFLADEITLGGFSDGAEAGDNGWTLGGFKATSGIESSNAPHYYIAEFRQYRTYDEGLQTGPYTFGRGLTRPNWADHYAYQDGLLITYWDEDQANNNTSQHRGEGLALPVDARPEPLRRVVSYDNVNWTFSPWTATVQAFDSTFGLEPTDALTLPFTGTLPPPAGSPAGTPNRVVEFEVSYPSQPAVPVFNDLNKYWSSATPAAGVIVPQTGTTIRVVSTSAQDSFMQIQVGPAK
ncbi:MAG TPA: immune inhibitor A domain-containing protein [Pyrinomonadaceae bacterium]